MADKKKDTKKTEEQIVKDGVHSMTNKHGYIYPKDPEVLKQLDYFKGLKLGFMMHWSPATQLGTMESWPLSDGDREWSKREIDWADNETFKQQYWDAPKTFNPVKFDPEAWAKLADNVALSTSSLRRSIMMAFACMTPPTRTTRSRIQSAHSRKIHVPISMVN